MGRAILKFLKKDHGQDLAEYCLLVAFIALVAAGILLRTSGGLQNLWTTANTSLSSTGSSGTGDATASAPAH